MALIHRAAYLATLVGLISHVWIAQTASFSLEYCADINTASTSANFSIYQSNGLCTGFCNGFSYAIIQDTACWCSDYTPASSTTTDLGECDKSCPGYPDETCGGDGLYGYLFMEKTPAGTKDTNGSSTSTTTSTESDGNSVATITTGGVVQTVTLNPNGSGAGSSSKGLSTGAAVGIAVGVVVAVAAIVGIMLFMWWKKRRERAAQAGGTYPSPRSSSAGMVSAMASMGEAGQARRGSKLIPIDERMEFNANIYNRGDGNPSSDSVNSLRDDVDYSRRVLRATNPDPPAQQAEK